MHWLGSWKNRAWAVPHTSTPCGRGKSGCLPAKHLKKACLELIIIWTFHPEIISNSALSRYIHRCLFSNATILAVTGRGTGLIGNRWTIIYIAKFLGSKYDNTKWKHDMFHSLLCCWWLNPRKVQRLARDFSWWSASGGLACSWPSSCPARSSHYLASRRGCGSRWPPPTQPRSSIFRSPRLRWCSLKEFRFQSSLSKSNTDL